MHTPAKPDQVRVVLGDVHAAHEGLEALLREVGAIDADGRRTATHYVVQLGDLLHLGNGVRDADLRTLEKGRRWIDLFILGNHEGFHAFGLDSCWWVGIHHPDELDPELRETLPRLAREGHWHLAAELDGWLLTHAGLHPAYQDDVLSEGSDAATVARELEGIFRQRLADGGHVAVIDAVGAPRGGGPAPGGCLWADVSELEPEIEHNRLRQIVGHTPQQAPRLIGDSLWAVDVGGGRTGRVSALVKEPGDDAWTPLVLEDAAWRI